jgi:hypothetical protein
MSTDVSEEHIASIFRVEKISSAKNQHESRWHYCTALYPRRLYSSKHKELPAVLFRKDEEMCEHDLQ